MADQNFKGQLISLCIKKGMTYDFPEISVEGPPHDRRFLCHAIVNGEKLGEGQHATKRGATNIAAKMALEALHAQEQSSPTAPQNPSQSPQLERSSSELNTSTEESSLSISCDTTENKLEINYIGRLNELRQKKNWQQVIFLDRQGGLHHIPKFFCYVIIGDKHFPETTGKTKKEAKKNAAFLALQVLKKENPDDTEIPDLNGSFGSESASGYSTPEKSSENESSTSDSKNSIVFSSNLTPAGPTRPLRKFELAPTFCNKEYASPLTCNERFLELFDTISELGNGGFGTVYKARKKMENEYYVVKKVDFYNEKVLAEVRALAVLDHPNIVRYFHSWSGKDRAETSSMSGESDIAINRVMYDFLFIQMEWCKHGNLKTWIEKMKKIDKEQSLNIFRQIVEGVVFIHSKGLIHRDLKPENIFFATQTTIKIGDFGLVAYMPREDEKRALQRTRGVGTKSYMAPEQTTDSYGNEVDIFPLGLILIELFMIFGTIMEKHKIWNDLRRAALPPSFSSQHPNEDSFIKLMLCKDPKRRPSATKLKAYFDRESLLYSKTI